MASLNRKPQAAVGSAKWVFDERVQAQQYVEQEAEEFGYSARNELEWLNEHMAEIFTKGQREMADVFKTPGKLRGKTPRTAKKQNPLESRAPLTDIFAVTPNANHRSSPAVNTKFFKQIAEFQVAEDKENPPLQTDNAASKPLGVEDPGKENIADEANDQPSKLETRTLPPPRQPSPVRITLASPQRPAIAGPLKAFRERSPSKEMSEESFVSAKEAQTVLIPADIQPTATSGDANNKSTENEQQDIEMEEAVVPSQLPPQPQHDVEMTADEVPSEAQSPESGATSSPERRPVLPRERGFSFAALPAPQPLGKKSMGSRVSRTSHFDGHKPLPSVDIASSTHAPVAVPEEPPVEIKQQRVVEMEEVKSIPVQESPATKTSTQRLHDRITLLGKQSQPRPSRAAPQHPSHSSVQERLFGASIGTKSTIDSQSTIPDDDWFSQQETQSTQATSVAASQYDVLDKPLPPLNKQSSPVAQARQDFAPRQQQTSATIVPVVPVPDDSSSDIEIDPVPSQQNKSLETTTPFGSPMATRQADGLLSASKNRWNDMLKSAKSLFATSAGAGSQTKSEMVQPNSAAQGQKFERAEAPKPPQTVAYPQLPVHRSESPDELGQVESQPPRRSSARLEKQKAPREPEQPKPTAPLVDRPVAVQSAIAAKSSANVNAPGQTSQDPNSFSRSTQMFKGRPIKPTRDAKNEAAKPQAVTVMVGSQRIPKGQPSATHSVQAVEPAYSAAPRPNLTKKPSNQSLKTSSSTSSFKGVKALEAAARKKEQDEREARRKAELKKELEKKRAAKAAEDEKLAQERRVAEQRALEAKAAIAKQALEQRKAEALKRAEQQRAQTNHQSQGQPSSRPESRMQGAQDITRPTVPHINPAKPPKRQWNPDDDDDEPPPLPPKSGASFVQEIGGKKQRISHDQRDDQPARPSQMTGPVRHSAFRNQPPSKFTPGLISQNPSSSQSSVIKHAGSIQHVQQHPKTPHNFSQYANKRPPFAEHPNPPQTGPHSRPATGHGKTPGKTPATSHKSSPQYPNGDNISLPDIATDDEDSDAEDNGFIPPDWANSPALRELLSRQQLVDPMEVFGPIGPLAMEEVFKGSKDRFAKFRNRTSSANWNGADRLTEEERKRDFDAREKMEKAGGWSFKDLV